MLYSLSGAQISVGINSAGRENQFDEVVHKKCYERFSVLSDDVDHFT